MTQQKTQEPTIPAIAAANTPISAEDTVKKIETGIDEAKAKTAAKDVDKPHDETMFVSPEAAYVQDIDLGDFRVKSMLLPGGKVGYSVPDRLLERFRKHYWVLSGKIVELKK